jgi:MFS family permease
VFGADPTSPVPAPGSPLTQPSLQPLSIREIINTAGSLYRQNLKPLLLLSFLSFVPIAVVGVALQLEMIPLGAGVENGKLVVATEEQLSRLNLVNGIIGIVTLLGLLVSMASLHNALSDAYVGQPVDWHASLRAGIEKSGWVAVIAVVIAALMIVPFIAVAVTIAGSSLGLFVVLMLGAFLFVLWASVATSLAMPALMREGVSGFTALNRSKDLVQGFWLRTLGIYVIAGLLSGLITLIVGKGLAGALTANARTPDALIGGASVGMIVANVLSTPLFVAFATVVYFDLRVRKEGYGPADFARESGIVRPAAAPPLRHPAHLAVSPPPGPTPIAPTAPATGAAPSPGPPDPTRVRGPRWSEPLPNER